MFRRSNNLSSRLTTFALIYGALVIGIWLIERYVGEHLWLSLLLASAPQIVFALPIVLLLVFSLAFKQWIAVIVNLSVAFFVGVLLLGLQYPISPTTTTTGKPIRVMTFNVEKWSHGAPAVAAAVRTVGPDVVCFQEAGDYPYVAGHQPDKLKHLLTGYHFVGQGELLIASRLPIRRMRAYSVWPGPDSRPLLLADLSVHGHLLTVATVHLMPPQFDTHLGVKLLDYCGGFAKARDLQGGKIVARLSQIKSPLVFCGDFNAQPQSEGCRRLTQYYPDAFELAGRGYGYTVPSRFPTIRIDHILVGNKVAVTSAYVPDIIASDHRPTVADLVVP